MRLDHPILRALLPPVVFASLVGFVFIPALIGTSNAVLAAPGTDLTLQFLAWRSFGFGQLAHGHLPLWNPHIFGGAPYFAGFQSALLYPPNWSHLLLSQGVAINWITALHVFAAGYFMYLWCHRRSSMSASILGGVMFMFSGPFFLHVYAGHLPHVAVLIWVPLILMAIDGLIETGDARWWVLGSTAVALQILAGHPQYVYYTGIVATIYFLISVVSAASSVRFRAIIGFAGMYLAACALAAVQLLPGLELTSETVRSGGLSYGMASTFSLPPENILTALAPNILGPIKHYIGRAYLWETSLFVSVTGLALAALGACASEHKRAKHIAIAMALICLILALGRHTPLYALMYRVVPKYSSFRGTVKFAAIGTPFICLLAALGFDRLRSASATTVRGFALSSCAILLVVLGGAPLLHHSFPRVLETVAAARTAGDDNELFDHDFSDYQNEAFVHKSTLAATVSLLLTAMSLAIVVVIALAMLLDRRAAYALLVLAALEMLIFARGATATTSATLSLPEGWAQHINALPRDQRVLITHPVFMNAGMYFGFDGVWGYDPGVLKRYAELMTFSQGRDLKNASQYLDFTRPHGNIFRAIRCAMVFTNDARQPVVRFPRPLPVALLLRNYLVKTDRESVLAALDSAAFDPLSSLVLESEPLPKPEKGASIGSVEIVAQSTDFLELKVEIETAAILLVTNNFSPGWRVRSLTNRPRREYQVQPANWAQQAIALSAGSHHLLLEYLPVSFVIGRAISLVTLPVFLVAGVMILRSRERLMTTE